MLQRSTLILGFALCSGISGHALAIDGKTADYRPETPAYITTVSETSAEAAKNFISGVAEKGIGLLSKAEMTEDQRQKEFRKLLHDSFDMKTIARFSLGRYWKSATPAEQKEYLKLFEDMIVKVYSRRFEGYDGQNLVVRNARSDNDNDCIVFSEIVPKSGSKIKVDWRVRSKGGKMSVVDIIVEGVSMSLTQRSDFASVIQRGGGEIEVLLTHLRSQNNTVAKN